MGRGLGLIRGRKAGYGRSNLPKGHSVRNAEARRLRVQRKRGGARK